MSCLNFCLTESMSIIIFITRFWNILSYRNNNWNRFWYQKGDAAITWTEQWAEMGSALKKETWQAWRSYEWELWGSWGKCWKLEEGRLEIFVKYKRNLAKLLLPQYGKLKMHLKKWGIRLKRFLSDYASYFEWECLWSYSVLVPQLYVGFLWANMLLYFIGLQIKRKSTWETTSGEPNLHLDWFRGRGQRLSWCHNGLRLWRSWGGCTVFCLWEWCELLWPEARMCYIVLSSDRHSDLC